MFFPYTIFNYLLVVSFCFFFFFLCDEIYGEDVIRGWHIAVHVYYLY